jgi:hypothetical protein
MQLTVLYSRRSRYAPLCINYNHYLGFRKPSRQRQVVIRGDRRAAAPVRGARQRLSRNLWAAPIKR